MQNIKEILSKLNESQIKPVLDTEGAVLVIAGAGSGKTRVLTSRIAYLILEKQVSPAEIMAITFTNKAANEMKERLKSLCGDISDMWVSTIHSMCVKILRLDIEKLGYDKNFTIYDETDKDRVLKSIIADLGLEEDLLKTAKNAISKAKNDCQSPQEYKNANEFVRIADEIEKIYSAYEKKLASSNSLDFDDLLFKTYVLFRDFPEVADKYSQRFKYIHIDEFQDTNRVQFLLAERLAIKNGNLFVVGDDDQSIYSWRGAKIENILKFDSLHKGAKVYKLEQNYRSSKKIIELANTIISKNRARRDKTLWTENGDGSKIEMYVGENENEEATYVALQIKNLVARGSQYKDFGVLMRVNAISRAFEQEFTKYAIPYRVFGGFRFFERKEIKDVLSYLKLINNPKDDESFLRSVSSPRRGIGEKSLTELKEFCTAYGFSIYESLGMINNSSLKGASKVKLATFYALIESFKKYSLENSPSKTLKFIIEKTDFLEQFAEKSEENTSRLYNISELQNTAEQFEKDNPNSTLADFLNSVTLSTDTDDITDDNAVTLATIHAVKGLEFPNVFSVGLDDTIIPLARAKENEEDLEEERRLMYVSVTRARERLYLTRAKSRYLYGKREFMKPSCFLLDAKSVLLPKPPQTETVTSHNGGNNDIKSSYYERGEDGVRSSGFSGGYSSTYAKSMLNSSKLKEVKNVQASKFKSGVKVKHAKFGEGTVIMVKGSGDNINVDVAFKGVGIKTLSIKYAPLEII